MRHENACGTANDLWAPYLDSRTLRYDAGLFTGQDAPIDKAPPNRRKPSRYINLAL